MALSIASKVPALAAFLAAMLLATSPANAQAMPTGVQSGTLNLIIANENGFVIAADSRMSRPNPFAYWDNSQKLFRAGPRSAAVISGFASWVAGGTPIDFQVAAALREEFSAPDWIRAKHIGVELPSTLSGRVAEQLTLFGGLLSAEGRRPDGLTFKLLAAGFDNSQVKLQRLEFKPKTKVWGPFDIPVPRYEPVSSTEVLSKFGYLTAGIDEIAKAILEGQFTTGDPRILAYYQARSDGTLDAYPLNDLERLATAILDETERATPFVGGPEQIGVFPKHGSVKWHLPDLPNSKQKLKSTALNVGSSYSWDGFPLDEYLLMKGKNSYTEISMSLVQPFDEPFTQVFLGGIIRDVPVTLDGNAFAGSRFINVHFRYGGSSFYFAESNVLGTCSIELAESVELPPNTKLRRCKIERARASTQTLSVGSRIVARPVGCVYWKHDRMAIKKTGHQRGFDCKNSRIEVSPAIGPFQLGPSQQQTGRGTAGNSRNPS